MRTITVYNDLHRYGPCPMNIELKADHEHYYMGDNVDLSHCNKKDVPMALFHLKYYKQAFAGRFVRGNHELNAIDAPDWIKVDNTLLTHGDFIFWTKKYATKYRKRSKGANFFRRWISISALDPIRHWLPEAKLHRRTLRKLTLLAKRHGCTMIVCAHRHPKNIINMTYNGIKIVVLPPGENTVVIK